MPTKAKLREYDSEPVTYCARCYSLKIKYEESIDSDCCMECGCSDVKTSSIEEWEAKYKNRYGQDYVVKKKDPKSSYIFKLPLKELKKRVFEGDWSNIIHKIYPRFPGGLGRADSIILFFDKLIKDNKLDDLRFILLNK